MCYSFNVCLSDFKLYLTSLVKIVTSITMVTIRYRYGPYITYHLLDITNGTKEDRQEKYDHMINLRHIVSKAMKLINYI